MQPVAGIISPDFNADRETNRSLELNKESGQSRQEVDSQEDSQEDGDEEEEEMSREDPFKGCEAIMEEEDDEDSQSEPDKKIISTSHNKDVMSPTKSVNNSDNNYADMDLFPGTRNIVE